jgi:signal transduction histidine kinase/CheY-like chemotaxis protein
LKSLTTIPIRHKFILALFAAVALALFLSGVFLFHFFVDLHEKNARKQIHQAFTVIQNDLSTTRNTLIKQVEISVADETLVSSLNLISGYENPAKYMPLVFDVEKKKITAKIAGWMAAAPIDDVGVYDVHRNLTAFVSRRNQTLQRGIITYIREKPVTMVTETEGKTWTRGTLPPAFRESILSETNGNVVYQRAGRKREYVEQSAGSRIIRRFPDNTEKTIGYILILHRIDESLLKNLSERIRSPIQLFVGNGPGIGTFRNLRFTEDLAGTARLFTREPADNLQLINNSRYFLHSHYLPLEEGVRAHFVIGIDKTPLTTAIQKAALVLAIVLLLSTLIVTLAGSIIVNRVITKPLERLADAVWAFRDGHSVRLTIDSRDEIGLLTLAFNEMTETIEQNHSEIRKYRDRLEELVEKRTTELKKEIHERTQAQKALKEAKESAEAATRAKSAFLAVMSHEIRTPLNAVLGMTRLVLETNLTEEQRDQLSTAESAAEHLLALIGDILDLSKIEADKISLESTPFQLREHLSETVQIQSVNARKKGLRLLFETAPGVENAFVGDISRIRQVLHNLLGNAVKFTEKGEIRLQVDKTEKGELRFRVSDTGVGIPKEKLTTIFEPFHQADSSITRKYGGSGLGLTISRRLVEIMGGALRAESRPGEGSVFEFTLFLPPVEHEENIKAPADPLPPDTDSPERLRILVVEDNPFNQKVMEMFLHRLGHAVTSVENGNRALETADAHRFDLILMDIQMPGLDGYQTTRLLREKETSGHTPIIAVTAHATEEDRTQCVNAGMDDYLTKPIHFEALKQMLNRYRRRVEAI